MTGRPAVRLEDNGLTAAPLYVATTGKPYPLLIEASDQPSDQDKITFTGYDGSRPVPLPPADQVIDSAVLPGG